MDQDSVQNIALNDIGQEYEYVSWPLDCGFHPSLCDNVDRIFETGTITDLFSPLTLLRTRTLFGRPSFSQIFGSLTESIENGSYLPGREATLKTRLGVYFCGVRPRHTRSPPSRLVLLAKMTELTDSVAECIGESRQDGSSEVQIAEYRYQVQ